MTSFYIYETQYEHPRTCEVCEKGIDEGYLQEDSGYTFCTTECVIKLYGIKDSVEMTREGSLFYTDWYDDMEALK